MNDKEYYVEILSVANLKEGNDDEELELMFALYRGRSIEMKYKHLRKWLLPLAVNDVG